jgi:hypothetical protein
MALERRFLIQLDDGAAAARVGVAAIGMAVEAAPMTG